MRELAEKIQMMELKPNGTIEEVGIEDLKRVS